MLTETANFYEAIRLILAGAGLWVCLWAFFRTGDGSWAFPAPVRDRMIRRRQTQLAVFAVADMAMAVAALIGAQTPETAAWTPLFLAGNWSIILTLVGLLLVTVLQVWDWGHFEDVAGPSGPAGPTPEEYRRLEHERNGYRAALQAHLAMLEQSDLTDLPTSRERRPATPKTEEVRTDV